MDDYLKPAEAAQQFGFTVEHLAQLRWRGLGPAYQRPTPRVIRYRRSDFEAWLAASTVQPSTRGRSA